MPATKEAPAVRSAEEILRAARIAVGEIYATLMPFTHTESEALWEKEQDWCLSPFGFELLADGVDRISKAHHRLEEMTDTRIGREYGPGLNEAWDYVERVQTIAFLVENTVALVILTHQENPIPQGPSWLGRVADLVNHQLYVDDCMPAEAEPAHA